VRSSFFENPFGGANAGILDFLQEVEKQNVEYIASPTSRARSGTPRQRMLVGTAKFISAKPLTAGTTRSTSTAPTGPRSTSMVPAARAVLDGDFHANRIDDVHLVRL
jgi:hypothetical protein